MDALFQSTTPHGWPQLVITCSGRDFFGRENNYAHGSTFVPTIPGRHEKYIKMFSPISSSWWTRFTRLVSGAFGEYINAPKTLSEADERDVIRVKGEGFIKIVFQIKLKNLDGFGFH